jgi:hypothetical protein
MLPQDMYLIPKAPRQVTLRVHPEGAIAGALFLSFHSSIGIGQEDLCDVLNSPDPFLVVKRADRDGPAFYNKRAIIRVDYEDDGAPAPEGSRTRRCLVSMMDGSTIEGNARYVLPPNRARLFDYLNINDERFIKLHLEGRNISLVNKVHVSCVSYLGDEKDPDSP